jgi:transcriptional regulator with XRE-family HTH domain
MTLSDYMARNGLSDIDMAALLNTDRKTVWRWKRGRVFPSPKAIREIAAATGGQVAPADWFADVAQAQAA